MAEGRTAFSEDPDGWYVEPPAATAFLLERETFEGGVWDPSCGQGNIVRTCLEHGLQAVGSDITSRQGAHLQPWWLCHADFLRRRDLAGVPARNIINNPPYGRAALAEAFIRNAIAMPSMRKVAMFLTAKFMFSDGRSQGLFTEAWPDRIYPIYPRPSCPPGQFLVDGGKAEGGVADFVWMVWDLAQPTGRCEVIWAPPRRAGAASPPQADGARPRLRRPRLLRTGVNDAAKATTTKG